MLVICVPSISFLGEHGYSLINFVPFVFSNFSKEIQHTRANTEGDGSSEAGSAPGHQATLVSHEARSGFSYRVSHLLLVNVDSASTKEQTVDTLVFSPSKWLTQTPKSAC